MKNQAFTLIELLVVVLIIGILAAIAVPQYQYAVLRSKYHTLMDMAQAIKNAQEVYFLANGKYAELFSDLDISFPENARFEKDSSGYDNMYFDDKRITIVPPEQVMSKILKDGKAYLAYNLKFDKRDMWGGARAVCIAWAASGELGKKVCKGVATFPETCSQPSYFSCRIYQ